MLPSWDSNYDPWICSQTLYHLCYEAQHLNLETYTNLCLLPWSQFSWASLFLVSHLAEALSPASPGRNSCWVLAWLWQRSLYPSKQHYLQIKLMYFQTGKRGKWKKPVYSLFAYTILALCRTLQNSRRMNTLSYNFFHSILTGMHRKLDAYQYIPSAYLSKGDLWQNVLLFFLISAQKWKLWCTQNWLSDVFLVSKHPLQLFLWKNINLFILVPLLFGVFH